MLGIDGGQGAPFPWEPQIVTQGAGTLGALRQSDCMGHGEVQMWRQSLVLKTVGRETGLWSQALPNLQFFTATKENLVEFKWL